MLAYTFLQLKNAAEHALGGVPDRRISKGLIVNRALNHLVNAHAWDWRQTFTTLDYVASQAWIELPADFGEIVQLASTTGRYTTIQALDAGAFMSLQQNGVSDTLYLGYYLAIGPQTVATAVPRWRMNIAPTPAASTVGVFSLLYRKLIPQFITDDASTADDAKVPAIPIGQHDTLYALVRAYAVAMEENPTTPEWQLAAAAIKRDIDASSRTEEGIMGPMRNTGVDNYYGSSSMGRRPFSEIDAGTFD